MACGEVHAACARRPYATRWAWLWAEHCAIVARGGTPIKEIDAKPRYGQSAWAAARLEPPTDRSLVWQVVRGKSCFEVTLFPGDDHEPHKRNGWNERNQQGETVDPKRETELKKRECEIDGVPAEAVGSLADDRCGRAVARDGRVSCPQRANCGDEKGDGRTCAPAPRGRADEGGAEPFRPKKMKHQAECDRAHVDERRTDEP